jgi:hypothetical protein
VAPPRATVAASEATLEWKAAGVEAVELQVRVMSGPGASPVAVVGGQPCPLTSQFATVYTGAASECVLQSLPAGSAFEARVRARQHVDGALALGVFSDPVVFRTKAAEQTQPAAAAAAAAAGAAAPASAAATALLTRQQIMVAGAVVLVAVILALSLGLIV